MVLTNDNEDSRKMVERCYKLSKTVVNPIIDWDDSEVWEFIREYDVPYCKLYDEGFRRLGCVGCPMGNNAEELEKYPKYKALYLRAFDRMLREGKERGIVYKDWETADDVYNWWVSWHK